MGAQYRCFLTSTLSLAVKVTPYEWMLGIFLASSISCLEISWNLESLKNFASMPPVSQAKFDSHCFQNGQLNVSSSDLGWLWGGHGRRLSHLCQETGGIVLPSGLHLLRLYYDPVRSARGVDGGALELKFGTQLDWTLLSNSLAQRSVLPFMHMVNPSLLFHQGFPGAQIMENKIWGG